MAAIRRRLWLGRQQPEHRPGRHAALPDRARQPGLALEEQRRLRAARQPSARFGRRGWRAGSGGAIAERPGDLQHRARDLGRAAARDRRQQRHDLLAADAQQLARPGQPVGVLGLLRHRPVEPRGGKGRQRVRIGDLRRAPPRRRTAGNFWNSRRRPSRTASASSSWKSVKKQNGWVAPHSSPMNSSGTFGASSSTACIALTAGPWRQIGDALAEGAVADLVVVLHEGDERGRRQMPARLAAHRAVAVAARRRPGRRSRSSSARASRSMRPLA